MNNNKSNKLKSMKCPENVLSMWGSDISFNNQFKTFGFLKLSIHLCSKNVQLWHLKEQEKIKTKSKVINKKHLMRLSSLKVISVIPLKVEITVYS